MSTWCHSWFPLVLNPSFVILFHVNVTMFWWRLHNLQGRFQNLGIGRGSTLRSGLGENQSWGGRGKISFKKILGFKKTLWGGGDAPSQESPLFKMWFKCKYKILFVAWLYIIVISYFHDMLDIFYILILCVYT